MQARRIHLAALFIISGVILFASCKKEDSDPPSGGSNSFALNCADAVHVGSLVVGQAASGVFSEIPYSDGDGDSHNGQTVTSTGVMGLTASTGAGTFEDGNGTLSYTISGTPASNGTAFFALDIGGQTCTISRTVGSTESGSIQSLSCETAINSGTLIEGQSATGITSEIAYSGGNGGKHNGQIVSSTGVTGLTATLNQGTFEDGDGTLIFSILGTPSNNGTASFALDIGSQTCVLSLTVEMNGISSLDCGSAINNGTLIEGQIANGVTSEVPYSGGNGNSYNAQTIPSTGVSGLTATLTAGNFASGNGVLNYVISGTPSGNGTASFDINIGGQSCTLSLTVIAPLEIGDFYQGGIIFYLDGNGGGLVAAESDQATDAEWGCSGLWSFPGGTAIGTGDSNTIAIENSCNEPETAADICANLSLNGYSDWFLPSLDELEEMRQNKDAIGNFAFDGYWSSSEDTDVFAWSVNFNGNFQANVPKTNEYRVRAVREF